MPRLPLVLALLLPLAACDTGDLDGLRPNTLSHDPAALVGTWDLITTTNSGMWSPPTTVPVDAGVETYTFTAEGTYTRVRNGDEIEAGAYVVDGMDLRLGDRREYFGIDGDRLYFDDRPKDGDLKEFARR